jgi:hypothetical protein
MDPDRALLIEPVARSRAIDRPGATAHAPVNEICREHAQDRAETRASPRIPCTERPDPMHL